MGINVIFLVLNIGELFLSNCTTMKVRSLHIKLLSSFSSNNVTF